MAYLRIPVGPQSLRRIRTQIPLDAGIGLVMSWREIDEGDHISLYVEYTPQPLALPGTMPVNRTPLPICYVCKKEQAK